jgi:maltokinase
VSVSGAGVDEVLATQGLADSMDELGAYIARQRWSSAMDSAPQSVNIDDAAVLVDESEHTLIFTVTRVAYDDGRELRYALPLGLRPVGDPLAERAPDYMIGTVANREALLYDALGDPAYVHWLWNAIRQRTTVRTAAAALRFECADPSKLEDSDAPAVRPMSVEQSNTSLQVGQSTFLKHLRRVEPGPAHELEMADALQRAGFSNLAALLGNGMYAPESETASPFVLLQPFVHNATEGWALALTSLRDLYAQAEEPGERDPAEQRVVVDEQGAAFVAESARLGSVIAQMHRSLAAPGLGAAFEPEPVTAGVLQGWADQMTADLDELLRTSTSAAALKPVRDARETIAGRFDALRDLDSGGLRIRIHGDLHLGQMLRTDSGWIVLDFEGEPLRSPQQRRERSSPLRDVAGMLRSFDYAAAAALDERLAPHSTEWERLMTYGDAWAQANRDAFWAAYLETVGEHPMLPPAGAALVLRRAFEVHKAVYEVSYELRHRPSWVGIPVRFLLRGAA